MTATLPPHAINLPEDAGVDDLQREGRAWGAYVAEQQIRFFQLATDRGLTNEQAVPRIAAGTNKDWSGTLAELAKHLPLWKVDIFETSARAGRDERRSRWRAEMEAKVIVEDFFESKST